MLKWNGRLLTQQVQTWMQELELGDRSPLSKFPEQPQMGNIYFFRNKGGDDSGFQDKYHPWRSAPKQVGDVRATYSFMKGTDVRKQVYVKGEWVIAYYRGNGVPLLQPHGNARKNANPYIKTTTKDRLRLHQAVRTKDNKEVLAENIPTVRSRKQISSFRHREMKKIHATERDRMEVVADVVETFEVDTNLFIATEKDPVEVVADVVETFEFDTIVNEIDNPIQSIENSTFFENFMKSIPFFPVWIDEEPEVNASKTQ